MLSFIETYKVPTYVCDKLIYYFNSNSESHFLGQTEGGYDTRAKKSIDIVLDPDVLYNMKPLNQFISNAIYDYNFKYLKFGLDNRANYTMYEGAKIKYYAPGDGYYKEHYESTICEWPVSHRIVSWILYLTDTPNAGTFFRYQNITIECVKGDLILFPAGFTHIHCGICSDIDEKYILNGWFHRVNDFNVQGKLIDD